MLVTLAYHLIDGTLDTVNAVAEERFAEHVAYLAGTASIVSIDEVIESAHGRRPMPARGVCITFDDGYRNVVTSALPVLAAAGAPATLYPVWSAIGRTNRWNPRASYDADHASADELREWVAAGMAIGGHGVDHLCLARLGAAELDDQVTRCRGELESLLQTPVRSFAYPYGAATPAARAAVARRYELAFAVRDGTWDPVLDPFLANRVFVHPHWSAEALAVHVERRLAGAVDERPGRDALNPLRRG